jgi:hypothetical protein
MFNNQGNSKPEASHSENGDMASEWEELVELDDVQLATVVGGWLGVAPVWGVVGATVGSVVNSVNRWELPALLGTEQWRFDLNTHPRLWYEIRKRR